MAWMQAGSLKGPKGDPGDPGDPGVGISSAEVNPTTGELILTLTDESIINVGVVKGADGTSIDVRGSVADEASLPDDLGPEDAGAGYITLDDGHLWIWDGESWVDAGEIRGPKGDKGDKGDDGILDFDLLRAAPSGTVAATSSWKTVGQARTITVTSTTDLVLVGEVSAAFTGVIATGSSRSLEFTYRIDGSTSGLIPVKLTVRRGESNTRLMLAKKRLSPGNHQVEILVRCSTCYSNDVSVPADLGFLALQVNP